MGGSNLNRELSEEIIDTYDCTHWIHETNAFLFLAKVRLNEEDYSLTPQVKGDPISYIDSIINMSNISKEEIPSTQRLLIQKSGEESTIVPISEESKFKLDISYDEIMKLRTTIEKIQTNQWDILNIDEVEYAQKILYQILISIDKY